jgi:signal transduction histidine kinase/FixJ family two-component response regulator
VGESIRDRILVVENDPLVADLIARQALLSAGYQTQVVGDATTAINRALQIGPDAIIANLDLPGLSGKDLMVALTSQGLDTPVIVLARKGQEADIIQAFRLGAVDYMLWPLKEPEVINVVERVLRSGRERKEREMLARQLQRTNQELQSRVRELTTIFAIGKAVTSITDQTLLFERILEGATRVTQADLGWFLMRRDDQAPFLLVSQRGLPASVAEHIQQPWDDGISSLVALSGEPLSIHGEPVKRFKIAGLGQSALIVPIKVQKQVIGLLTVMRRKPLPFNPSDQHLLQAVADYASISISNALLFREVAERARSLENLAGSAQTGEKINHQILMKVKNELRAPLAEALSALDKLAKDPTARWNPDQRQGLARLQDQLQSMSKITEAIVPPRIDQASSGRTTPLSDLVRQAVQRFQGFAQRSGLALVSEIRDEPLMVPADAGHISQALDGLLSNALKFSNPGGEILIRVEKASPKQAHLMVCDHGPGLDSKQVAALFNPEGHKKVLNARVQRFGGLGVNLALVKEIITQQNGKIWVESEPGSGTTFHFTLPIYS